MMHERSIFQLTRPAPVADRSAQLVTRIKIETRWLLLGAIEPLSTESARRMRTHFLAGMRAARKQRVPARMLNAAGFYHEARLWAEAFSALIAARRNRQHEARP